MDLKLLNNLISEIKIKSKNISETTVVSGFDAMVDQISQVVGERTTPEKFKPMKSIDELGAWTTSCAGKSGLREALLLEETAGGCTQNMGDGIASLGFMLDVYACLGEPVHWVFESFVNKCHVFHSIMEPGKVSCYEFDDGKIMLAYLSHFAQLTPASLSEKISDGAFLQSCKKASAIAFTSWSLFPYMTDCWKYLQSEVLSKLKHKPHIYIDLADPASRSSEDILGMLDSLKDFEVIGRTTLSLNGNEANQLACLLKIDNGSDSDQKMLNLAQQLREYCQISEVGIHLVKKAVSATSQEVKIIEGPYCENPIRTVGAGDRYNAGYIAGLLLNLNLEKRLLLGNITSGFFVTKARSASVEELLSFAEGFLE